MHPFVVFVLNRFILLPDDKHWVNKAVYDSFNFVKKGGSQAAVAFLYILNRQHNGDSRSDAGACLLSAKSEERCWKMQYAG